MQSQSEGGGPTHGPADHPAGNPDDDADGGPGHDAHHGAEGSPGTDIAGDQGGEDEVDRLVAAWRRELPELDVSPFQVLSRVTRLARHLDRARRLVFSVHDLESWEFDVLTALRRAGTPYELSPTQLLTQTLVTSGTMTNRVDRLAGKGLVERRPDPADRRGVRVRLSADGRTKVDAALADLLEHEHNLLAGLSPADQARLANLLRGLVGPFDQHT